MTFSGTVIKRNVEEFIGLLAELLGSPAFREADLAQVKRESIADIITRVPSHSSTAYGRPFLEIFEAAGRDFYKIDPLLFSPAQIVFQNLETGRVHIAGKVNEAVLRASFGIS